jgi:hypothetical protein
MTLVTIDDRGRSTIKGARPGAYDAELFRDGQIHLIPLVRATDRRLPKATSTVARPKVGREQKNRSWLRVPAGTVLSGPHLVGKVTLDGDGRLTDGRSPNRALTDNGITRNAWDAYRLPDGRTVGEAYDNGEWD